MTSRCQFDGFYLPIIQQRKVAEVGRKVVRATGDIAHQFQAQKVKGQGHQATLWVAVQVKGAGRIVTASLGCTACFISKRCLEAVLQSNMDDELMCEAEIAAAFRHCS